MARHKFPVQVLPQPSMRFAARSELQLNGTET